jgi:Right handed beta helix region
MLALVAAASLAVQVACSCSTPPSILTNLTSPIAVPAPTRAPGLSLYVSADGDDRNSGTRNAPFRTMRKAASIAIRGMTIYVAPGTYSGSFRSTANGTPRYRIAYVSETKWGARLVGNSGEDAVWRNDGDYVDITGFDISGTSTDGLLETGSDVRISGNHIHGFVGGTCISTYKVNYTLHDIDIVGNVVHSCGSSSQDHGIYVGQPGGSISNNISYGNSGYGIHCWHNCNHLTIANNLVFNNREGGIIVGQGDGPNYGKVEADNFIVSNNIAVFNGNAGITESGAVGSNNKYSNNNVYGNKLNGLRTGSDSKTITRNPAFINFQADGAGNYHLRSSSPDIDAGTDVGAPKTDIDGRPRPRGGGFDIGVYER